MDDLLLYLSNAITSVPHVMKIITIFSEISGYKMNMAKTELLAIDSCKKVLEKFAQFQIQKKFIKYLGTYISHDKTQLYKDNFLPLVKDFKKDVRKWQDLKVHLIGRINLFKMMWLPKFLFKFQTIPITPPKTFFKEVISIISSFIWSNKASRLSK